MPVRLLTGIPFSVDGFAINDFETMPDGDLTNLNVGVSVFGGCFWYDSMPLPRE